MKHYKLEELKNCPICESGNFKTIGAATDHLISQDDFNIVSCVDCGFTFTNPRPVYNDIAQFYKSEEYVSHSNTTKGLVNLIYHKVRQKNLKSKYKLITRYKKKGSILDIGSGSGEFLDFFSRNGWTTCGIEPDIDARQFAKSNYKLEILAESSIKELPDNHYDVITMWHVLEHVHELKNRVKELKRLLKDDGVLIIAVPNFDSPDSRKYNMNWAALDVPRHLYHFTKKSLRLIFVKQGWHIITEQPMVFDAYYVSMLSEKHLNHSFSFIRGMLNGAISNLKARFQQSNHSSIIFVLNLDK